MAVEKKALLVVASFFVASAAQAHTLSDLSSIQRALSHGRRVSVSIDLSLCAPVGSATASQTKGGLASINAYRISSDGTLSFADQHLTVSTSNQPIQQFLRYQVRADNSVIFSSYIFALPSYTLTSQVAYNCAINNGVSFDAD